MKCKGNIKGKGRWVRALAREQARGDGKSCCEEWLVFGGRHAKQTTMLFQSDESDVWVWTEQCHISRRRSGWAAGLRLGNKFGLLAKEGPAGWLAYTAAGRRRLGTRHLWAGSSIQAVLRERELWQVHNALVHTRRCEGVAACSSGSRPHVQQLAAWSTSCPCLAPQHRAIATATSTARPAHLRG